jgi:gliding motility-associated lipoprotein GldH
MNRVNRKKGIRYFWHIGASLLPVACCLLFFSSCTHLDLYEKNTIIPKYQWKGDFEAAGTFEISDTLSLHTINIVLRHTDAYKYNNIWLNFGLQLPGDTMSYQKIDIPLGNDANGWYGSGMDDIWEYRAKLNTTAMRFNKQGTYHFIIKQIMRDDPLLHVISAGVRVEKEMK